MKKPLVVANWKMNTDLGDAIVLATSVKNTVVDLGVEVVVCPPSIWLYPIHEIFEKAPKNYI